MLKREDRVNPRPPSIFYTSASPCCGLHLIRAVIFKQHIINQKSKRLRLLNKF